jgi:hypothetical protein
MLVRLLAPVLLFAAIACGAAPPSAHAPTAAALAPCPADDAVAARLRAAWRYPDDVTVTAACAPGRFGAPGWFVVAQAQSADDASTERRYAIVSPDFAVLTQLGPEPIDFRSDAALPTLHVLDLDADGIDEVVVETRHDEGGVGEAWLSGFHLIAGALAGTRTSVPLEYDDPRIPLQCTSQLQIAPPAITVRAAVVGAPGAHCLTPGDHHVRLVGGDLAVD